MKSVMILIALMVLGLSSLAFAGGGNGMPDDFGSRHHQRQGGGIGLMEGGGVGGAEM